MTATVRQLPPAEARSLADAIATYLTVGLAGPEHDRTRRVYGGILRRLADEFGEDTPAASLEPDAVAEWFARTWAEAAPSTWNVALGVIRSAGDYWTEQGWADANPAARLRRRRTPPDRDRALSARQDRAAAHGREDPAPRAAVLAAGVRDRREVERSCSPWTSETWTSQPARPRHPERRAPATRSCGRRPPRDSSRATSGAAPKRPLFVTARGRPATRWRRATWTPKAGPGCHTSRPRHCSSATAAERHLHQLQALGAHPRRRGGREHADDAGAVRPHLGPRRWPSTPGCPPRRCSATRKPATPPAGANPSGRCPSHRQ